MTVITTDPWAAAPGVAPAGGLGAGAQGPTAPNRRLDAATKIGEEHAIIDRVKLSGKLAGGLVGAAIAVPVGAAKGLKDSIATEAGRSQLKKAALLGGAVSAGIGAALGVAFGAALLGPVGALVQGVKGALVGLAAGSAMGAAARLATSAATTAAQEVPEGWTAGRILGEQAATRSIHAFAASLIWLGEKSTTLHRIGLAISRLGQDEPEGKQHQRVLQVDTHLWRSAQPGPDVWPDLKARGFNSVVNLRLETNYEKDAVQAAGLKAFYLPESPLKAPTVAQALEFLKFVTDPANQPVLFHCYSGIDRTGTMAACYRIAVQGWTQEQALAECLSNGMVAELQQDKIRFIKEFNTAWTRMKSGGTAPTF